MNIYKSYRIQVIQRREAGHISLLYKVCYKGLQIGQVSVDRHL